MRPDRSHDGPSPGQAVSKALSCLRAPGVAHGRTGVSRLGPGPAYARRAVVLVAAVFVFAVAPVAPLVAVEHEVSPADVTGSTGAHAAAPPSSDRAEANDRCLSRHEQRVRIASKAVVPLARAASVGRSRGGDLLRARLCERDGRLVYLLTFLARGGKVLRVAVDASSGALINPSQSGVK